MEELRDFLHEILIVKRLADDHIKTELFDNNSALTIDVNGKRFIVVYRLRKIELKLEIFINSKIITPEIQEFLCKIKQIMQNSGILKQCYWYHMSTHFRYVVHFVAKNKKEATTFMKSLMI